MNDNYIRCFILIFILFLVGILSSLFILPLLLVLKGSSVYLLSIYAFIWPLVYIIKGVLEIDGEQILKDIKERLND